MEKPAIKVENGIVTVSMSAGYDGNNDAKQSVKGMLNVEIDAYELVKEIAKKDLPLLQLIISQIKA